MMYWGHEVSWGWMIFGWLMMLVFWGGSIGLILLAIRGFLGGRSQPADSPGKGQPARERSPVDILKERYAKGEIEKREFDEILSNLEG